MKFSESFVRTVVEKCFRKMIWLVSILVAILSSVFYILTSRLGYGVHFPIQPYNSLQPLLNSSSVEVVATLDYPPGNIAVSKSGRVFFNFHPEFKPKLKLVEYNVATKEILPFPNLQFQNELVTCLSMRIDNRNQLWLIDFAQHGILGTPKLIFLI